ncbi:MAG: UDP-N-acetylenolpyruvoylglucosamine reductase [Candidatus Spechtbacteria bacterium RIFCSPHIGHO2_02_FULL_43_15b]|uniref:UDP-N-acetylenolpyruvoylglucosamine reductase n=1 Tax=Candidatus Spechtbacteria bacterium RIFCSPHIGHO2_01_FULL_43_30 TaxID=1802158 RepID=A0A1G2H4A4_9BACT|nr:MAG: UDP-N-acetylenolpyruvoylglucosamine reductase [Candidatus Spechtbacteria bacterium RIFCSPHIGHO2_01_FULL_43_30]OGZ59012.1 MAG: UDP-N-acetylenolpyruvoylglucosamine reductase [Candidatus Spechtbacteria bacterium RIFCSPHIGHO2_02_FULL_43_15b]
MILDIQKNVPLSVYTTYKIGGSARFFCDAQNEQEIIEAFAFARRRGLPYFILGGGSNILVSDKGFDGLVIRVRNSGYKMEGEIIEAGVGMDLQNFVDIAIASGLQGIEWASGIPGTLGGAVRGNAGAFGGEMKDIVISIRFMDRKGNIRVRNNEECKFGYRTSVFKQMPGLVIISATIQLKRGDRKKLLKFSGDTIALRASRHPLEFGSCGSVFKAAELKDINPRHFEKYPRFKNLIKNDPFPVIPMACFLDEADLKNYRIGGAMVSDKHPNFFVNYDNASANDVVTLISLAKQRILHHFKIVAEEEVQYVGF